MIETTWISISPSENSPSRTSPLTAAPADSAAKFLLRPILREPDSLAIEQANLWRSERINDKEILAAVVYYRANNGFGGSNRDHCVILYDPAMEKYRLMLPDQFAAARAAQVMRDKRAGEICSGAVRR